MKRPRFTCAECVRLLGLCAWDDDRLSFLRLLAPVITDRESDATVVDAMEFMLSKDKAHEMLDRYKD